MSRLSALVILLFAQLARGQDSTPVPTPDMFAFGVELAFEGANAGIYRTTLPAEIYRTSVQELTDLRVFSAASDVVPHALRPLPPSAPADASEVELPLFPLRGGDARPASPITIDVISNAQGTRVHIDTRASDEPAALPEAYLVDASKLAQRPGKLSVAWTPQAEPVWVDVTVEASEDLRSWHGVGRGVLASLDHAGQTLERHGIALDMSQSDRYLRLHRVEGKWPLALGSVVASFEPVEARSPLAVLDLAAKPLEVHTYLFDTGGPFLASELGLALVEENTLINATLSSADQKRGPFTERYRGRFFRLGGDTPLESLPAELEVPVRARYWKLVVDGRGGGVGRSLPALRVGYRPDEIVWVARGKGPFTLAYGSAQVEAASLHASDIVGAGERTLSTARLGAWRKLGGESRLLPPKPSPTPTPWRVYVLWSVLALAALSVVVLSIRLATRPAAKNE